VKIRFLENGRRAHPKDPTYPQLQHAAGEVYDLPDEMALDALSSRNAKGEARCEIVEEPAEADADSQAAEEARIAADAAKAKAAENTGAKEPKREDKKGRGAKALE